MDSDFTLAVIVGNLTGKSMSVNPVETLNLIRLNLISHYEKKNTSTARQFVTELKGL